MSKSLIQVAQRDRTRREITHRSDHIPPLPENVTRLLALLDKEDTEPEHLEVLVSQDQVLVGRLLRLANSPLYGVSREMASIKDATMVVGFRGLRSLIMASSTAQHLKRDFTTYGFGGSGLWLHSLAVGCAARFLARKLRMTPNEQEEMFIVGLLHDIGKLVLVNYLQESRQERGEEQTVVAWEQEVCGVDHAEASGMVAEKWSLASKVVQLLRYHHTVEGAPKELERDLTILSLANSYAHVRRLGFDAIHLPERKVAEGDLEALGLTTRWVEIRDDLDALVDAALQEMGGL